MLDTLSNIKARLGIVTSDDDTFLTQQATLISDVIEAYCRRKLGASNWVQNFYEEDLYTFEASRKLVLFQYPLVEVTAVTISGQSFDLAHLRIHKPTGTLLRKDCGIFRPTDPFTSVDVSYRAGYEAGSMPTPILAVLDALVSERYNKKKSGIDLNFGSDIQSISIPGAISVQFDFTLANNERSSSYGTILGNYANVLDDWRSERSVIGAGKLEYVEVG